MNVLRRTDHRQYSANSSGYPLGYNTGADMVAYMVA